ncbi:MAG: ATP-binding protein, partial [Ottowia sp.]
GGLLGSAGAALKEALFGRTGPRGGQYDGIVQNVVKGEMRRMGRELVRGALGSLLGGKRR